MSEMEEKEIRCKNCREDIYYNEFEGLWYHKGTGKMECQYVHPIAEPVAAKCKHCGKRITLMGDRDIEDSFWIHENGNSECEKSMVAEPERE